MNDIYIELKDIAIKNNIRFSTTSSTRNSVQEFNPEFRAIINKVQTTVQLIKMNNEQIEELKQDLVGTASTEREREINAKMQNLASQNMRHTNKIKELMQKINDDLEKSQKENPDEPETQAKVFQIRAIQNEIKEVLNETQNVHQDYKAAANAKIKRQMYILNPNLTEEEQKKILQDPKGMENFVMKELLGQPSLQLQYALEDAKEKSLGIRKLEQSCQQIFQQLNEISALVKTQGEMIDDIEIHLQKAQDYIKKTNKVLEKTKATSQTNRKKLCCIVFLGLGILALILTPFIVQAVKNN
ncbi:SNARE domain protein (macronuclear) [Tetrahymena thermophila SB210]|uniref:SNARE domain protein n=1 Tax=Tetrahymena thermophila (strain SB210) TaxID=312017 RepID=Q22T25_TETTS|nr:SNARE domain protein [Tetrahymena thermophila SB210]EAR88613.2 SNARE domain protein [Tetrahymena thermophila SB210]|eukprot:XP_001008858.2 SNARE domain protein [Tetrahymena thermophila SB210]